MLLRGCNFTGVRALCGAEAYAIDFNRTITDHVHDVQALLGLESVIHAGLIESGGSSGCTGRYSCIRLLLQIISWGGTLWSGLGRHALSQNGGNVLCRVSNDSPATHLRDAAWSNRVDPLTGTAGVLMFAKGLGGGTGASSIVRTNGI